MRTRLGLMLGLMVAVLGLTFAQTLVLTNGDVNGDNQVDDTDQLAVLFAQGQSCPQGCPEDLNGDGVVDDTDLLIVQFGMGAQGATPLQGELRYAYGAYTINASIQLRDTNPNRSYPLTLWAQAVGSSNIYETSTTLYGASGTVQIFVPEPGLYRLQAFVPGGSWLRGEVSVAVGLEVRNLSAVPGNGCVALMWDELPANAFSGYRVYRRVGSGAWTQVDNLPSAAYLFGDTGLTNGATYQYKIAVVGISGEVLSESQVVSAVPTGAVPQLVWDSSSHQGDIFVVQVRPSQVSNFTGIGGFLLVDKVVYTGVGPTPDPYANIPRFYASIDMADLPSGTHTLQVIDFNQNYAYVTPPISVSLSSEINNVVVPSLMWIGRSAQIRASLPSDTTGWVVQVLDINDQVRRQWSGSGTDVNFVWDGTDASGVPLAKGLYEVSITAQRPSGSRTVRRSVTLAPYSFIPNAIALISSITDPVADRQYAKHVERHMARIETRAISMELTFDYLVIIRALRGEELADYLRFWLSSSLMYFYLYGHGNMTRQGTTNYAFAWWGALRFDSRAWASSDEYTKGPLILVSNLVANNPWRTLPFLFVFMDTCSSAGNNSTGLSDEWRNAFDPLFGTVVGWFGYGYANRASSNWIPPEGDWLVWRSWYWDNLGTGWSVGTQAYNLACPRTPRRPTNLGGEDEHPCDTGKFRFFGFDITLP